MALPPGILAIRRDVQRQPPAGYGSAAVLRYDLAEAGATGDVEEATVGAILWALTALQAELTEWCGRPWPAFPAARTDSAGEPASWQVRTPEGTFDVLGFLAPSGWSLRVMDLPTSPSA